MIKQIIIGLPLRSHRIFLIICMITDRIGLQSVLLPLLRPFGNAQKGACKLFGILSRTQYMSKKVYHMAYYASSLTAAQTFSHSNAVIRFKATWEISDMQFRAKKGTLSSH